MRTIIVIVTLLFVTACNSTNDQSNSDNPNATAATGSLQSGTPCQLEQSGWGPSGSVPLRVEKAVTGLRVPWAIAFLPGGDWLVTERQGSIRLVRNGQLVTNPVATVATGASGEGGLLGLALHPQFTSNSLFYVFYSTTSNARTINRIERFTLSSNHAQATSNGIILDNIPASTVHDGGRIKFGPDGNLYISTGDAQTPQNAQNPSSLNGKILRITPDGAIPGDNPLAGSPVYASGVRNPEAFDWVDSKTMIVADHGPSGELGLSGRDEISFLQAGSNLGWPLITACQTQTGLINPILSWQTATPPGGGVICNGCAIPEFNGNFIVGILGTGAQPAHQLQRIVFDPLSFSLVTHEVYLKDQFGRLRDVEQGPDGALYVTTSNCDGRGSCPSDGDYILKITHQ